MQFWRSIFEKREECKVQIMLRVEAMKRRDQQDEDNPGHVSTPHNFSHHIISLGPVAVQQCAALTNINVMNYSARC